MSHSGSLLDNVYDLLLGEALSKRLVDISSVKLVLFCDLGELLLLLTCHFRNPISNVSRERHVARALLLAHVAS